LIVVAQTGRDVTSTMLPSRISLILGLQQL